MSNAVATNATMRGRKPKNSDEVSVPEPWFFQSTAKGVVEPGRCPRLKVVLEIRTLGVTVCFRPRADIQRKPDWQIINPRSSALRFSSLPCIPLPRRPCEMRDAARCPLLAESGRLKMWRRVGDTQKVFVYTPPRFSYGESSLGKAKPRSGLRSAIGQKRTLSLCLRPKQSVRLPLKYSHATRAHAAV